MLCRGIRKDRVNFHVNSTLHKVSGFGRFFCLLMVIYADSIAGSGTVLVLPSENDLFRIKLLFGASVRV